VEPLAKTLREAMDLSDGERRAMGENGRRLVEEKYAWPAIAEQMKAAYEWILNGEMCRLEYCRWNDCS
jgi:glycosyltransferase involved in cell wall biosynthesis